MPWSALRRLRSSSRATGPSGQSARTALLRAQNDALLAHTSLASAISTVAALILAMYLAPIVGTFAAQAWFGLKVAAAVPRFLLGQAYVRRIWRPEPEQASQVVQVSLAIDGAIWGLVGVWGASWHSETAAGLLLGCLSSVAMLATFGLQVQLRATVAFVVPIMTPMAVALAWRGDALGITAAGGAALVLVQSLVTGYASERRMAREHATHERLEHALLARSEALVQVSETSRNLEDALVDVKRQSAVKAVFLGMMSHELRTPLHGILGLAELAKRQVTDERTMRELALIESSGRHLLDLIGALLDVARIDSGHLQMHPKAMELSAEMRDMGDLYAVRAQLKGIQFRCTVDMPSPCWIEADHARIRQVLHNLLGNAIKFTDRGHVSLHVRKAGDVFSFEISDSGKGIPAADIHHIFDAFRQTGDTARRPSEGTGLGLTIAKEIAEAMGGGIKVASVEGRGSTFMFTAQLPECAMQVSPISSEVSDKGVVASMSGHVLLAEDNDVNSIIALAHLQALGLSADRVENGEQALLASTSFPRPSLVLMDCRMPVVDGLDATRAIRLWEQTNGAVRVPIIALTAAVDEGDRIACRDAGMDAVLAKPFTAEQLSAVVATHTRQAEPSVNSEYAIRDFALSLEDSDDLVHGSVLH